jgi:carbonic anhydrase/acetyltransferase-like protein (isoleucine patch superfamily)
MIDLTDELASTGVIFVGLGRVLYHPGSTITIRAGSIIGTPITVLGGGNSIVIGERCILQGGITLKCKDSRLVIGSGVTWGSVNLMMHESNQILIGDDCMFSSNIFMDVSDMHPIYNLGTELRNNYSQPIVLGDHVWVGYGVILLRGTAVQTGSIIGAGSVVKGLFEEKNCVIAGNPGRIVKSSIRWERQLPFEAGNVS